jgi:4-hydroxysphinganine ceramide fatty acyl 2-hydroxylase
MSKEQYVRYVAEPKHLINPVRNIIMFDTPYLEIFTKTPWYAIPIAWLPWCYYFIQSNELPLM